MVGLQIPSKAAQLTVSTTNSVWIYDTMLSVWADLCPHTREGSTCTGSPEHSGSAAICTDSFGQISPFPRCCSSCCCSHDNPFMLTHPQS